MKCGVIVYREKKGFFLRDRVKSVLSHKGVAKQWVRTPMEPISFLSRVERYEFFFCSGYGFLMPGLRRNDLSYREDKTKRCSVAFFTFDRNVTVMEVDGIFHNFCAESRSFFFSANGLSSKEAVSNFRRHASPRIGYSQLDSIRTRSRRSADRD